MSKMESLNLLVPGLLLGPKCLSYRFTTVWKTTKPKVKYNINQSGWKEEGYEKMETSCQKVFNTLWNPREQTREPVFNFPSHIE